MSSLPDAKARHRRTDLTSHNECAILTVLSESSGDTAGDAKPRMGSQKI